MSPVVVCVRCRAIYARSMLDVILLKTLEPGSSHRSKTTHEFFFFFWLHLHLRCLSVLGRRPNRNTCKGWPRRKRRSARLSWRRWASKLARRSPYSPAGTDDDERKRRTGQFSFCTTIIAVQHQYKVYSSSSIRVAKTIFRKSFFFVSA